MPSSTYTQLGQLSQAPLNGSGTAQQYLYCNSSHPHQLTGVYPTGTTCSNPTGATYSASYDSWGNITSRTYAGVTATLTYDVLDHLVKWDAGTGNKEWYAYDASGNRVLLRSITTSGTNNTTYPFGLEEHTYNATGSNIGNTYYYTLGGRLIGALSGTTTLNTQFFLTDALGNVLAAFSATAGSAAVLGNQIYGPYGNRRYNAGPMGTTKGFTGQYGDPSGLDYYNARYYDPVVGVFLSADMVQGNAQGLNPYGYVGGNPEIYTDPTGQYFVPPGGGGGSNGGTPPSCVQLGDCGSGSSSSGNNPPPTPTSGGSASGNPKIRMNPGVSNGTGTDKRARSVAYLLALEIAAWRQYSQDWSHADFANAMWYLTDQNDNGNFFLGADTLLGYHNIPLQRSQGRSDPLHTTDAEQQVLSSWLLNGGAILVLLALKLARMTNVNATLHIVLFTELPPCGQCEDFFRGMFASTMSAIGTAIMNGPPALDPWPTGQILSGLSRRSKHNCLRAEDGKIRLRCLWNKRFPCLLIEKVSHIRFPFI